MKIIILLCLSLSFWQKNYGQKIAIPDTVESNGMIASVSFTEHKKNRITFHFGRNTISLHLKKNQKALYFEGYDWTSFTSNHFEVTRSLKEHFTFIHEFKENEIYKIYFSAQKDSIGLYTSYYLFLPEVKKWKYLGIIQTKSNSYPKEIKIDKSKKNAITVDNVWLQKSKGGWHKVLASDTNFPVLRPFRNIDSVAQNEIEQKILKDSLLSTSTFHNGLYYQMIKTGSGEKVNITDTVTIHYKGWNFASGKIFDQTKEKPATFPLSRLIPGWQIGLPLCNVGGTIRLFIPSGLAYGIRNVAPEISPNSILIFDIEVLSVKKKVP